MYRDNLNFFQLKEILLLKPYSEKYDLCGSFFSYFDYTCLTFFYTILFLDYSFIVLVMFCVLELE